MENQKYKVSRKTFNIAGFFKKFEDPEMFNSLNEVEQYLQGLKERNWNYLGNVGLFSRVERFEAVPSLDNQLRREIRDGLVLHRQYMDLKIKAVA